MAPGYPILLVVAAALIDTEGRVLLQQRAPHRSMPGLWEFPGGKVETGETPEAALTRELEEELGVRVSAAAMTPVAFASDTLGERHLVLLLYAAREWDGEPYPFDASAIRWVAVKEMEGLPMPPADVPLVAALTRFSDLGDPCRSSRAERAAPFDAACGVAQDKLRRGA